jgi:hypothetical protein
MKVYIAGPMTGLPQHNFKAFDAAKRQLKRQGHKVVSPADIDRMFGITGRERPEDLAAAMLQRVMLVELRAIGRCDALTLLPGWQRSKGAAIEILWANMWRVPIYTIEEFLTNDSPSPLILPSYIVPDCYGASAGVRSRRTASGRIAPRTPRG